jgi:two-component system sensor histidine kinase/response regulator
LNSDEQATILVVDDNPTNLRMLVDYLREIGYRTLVANSGERALAQLERVQPDLILLDVMMPGIDGFETCRRIKAVPAAVDIPIIFMTALSETQHKLDGFQAGAVDYVTKPFQQEEMSARISAHLMIQRQRRELERVNAAKDLFISVIGHDLRGPFSVLLGFSEMLADPTRELSKADRDRFGAMLRQSALNAHGLLENLMMWSTVSQGTMAYNPSEVDLHAAITETFDLLRYSASLKDLTLSHALSPNTAVHTDPYMLSTILRNLIANAIKFTPNGGSVLIDGIPKDDQIEVRIHDTGVGMSEENIARLSASETLLTDTGTEGEIGTGLGLFLCRRFVEHSGGRLWADRLDGEGTVFHFTVGLPKPSASAQRGQD